MLFALFPVSIMASPFPSVLFAGHSFVKRLHSDLQWKFYFRAALDFNLTPTATVSFHGVGGLTVPRLARELRLLFSHQPPPRVIILEIGTNDLTSHSPEAVIGDLLDLVKFLQSVDSCQLSVYAKSFLSFLGDTAARVCLMKSSTLRPPRFIGC